MTSDERSRKRFLGGVAVLTASTAAVKIIGLFYKIPLIHLVGIEGMAYFLAAYHIYTLLFTLSTAGLPVAVSILVSKRHSAGDIAAVERIYRVSLGLFSVVGGICTAVLYFGSDLIAEMIEIPDAAHCIRAVAPALLFTAAGSAVKGYFQGQQDMKPTAISQIIESVIKLALGLMFGGIALKKGYDLPTVAAYAIFGLTSGVIISTVYLFIVRAMKKPTGFCSCKSSKKERILGELISISAPITLGAVVISVTSIIDTALISSRLQSAGFSQSVANSIYSSYGNLSIPLFNLVPAFISPIALSMAPMIAEATSKRERLRERELLESSFRLCALISIPASLGLAIFGREILGLIFSSQVDAISIAAPLLSVLSPAIFFSCLITVTNAALQSYGKATKPIISMAIGAGVKIVAEYLLVGDPNVNIMGAPISTVLCDLTIVLINLYFIKKHTCGTRGVSVLFAPTLIAATAASGTAVLCAMLMTRLEVSSKIMIFAVVVFDVLMYAVLVTRTNAITENDIKFLPQGEKIYKILKKTRLLR